MASAINEQVLNTFLAAHARLATAMKGISGQLGGKTPQVSQKDFQELIGSGADLLKESVKLAVLLGVKLEASEEKKTAAKKTTAKKAVAKKEEAAVEQEVEESNAGYQCPQCGSSSLKMFLGTEEQWALAVGGVICNSQGEHPDEP